MRFGTGRMMSAALALALSMGLAGAAGCQSRTRMETVDGAHRVTLHSSGEVRFTDDDHGIAYLAPGARLEIEEVIPGRPDRRVEYRGRAGGFDRSVFRDGRPARATDEDEAWIERSITHALRENGSRAAERVARFYRQGGTDAVLREIALIGGDAARRAYYIALLRQPLRPGETARVLRDAGQRIGSDGDKRMVLESVLERGSASAEAMEAMLEAATCIGSDGDRSRLLVRAAERGALDDAGARQAYFRGAETLGSDGDKSRVLVAALTQGGARRDAVVQAVRAARTLGSDGDKARVLTSVPPQFLRDAAVRSAFEDAMLGIGSDGDRSRVAVWLARSLP